MIQLGAMGDDPTVRVETSWNHLAQTTLDVIQDCVGSSQHGFGGNHQDEIGVGYLITHTRAIPDLKRGATNKARGSGR